MTGLDSQRLFDVTTRLALFVENVKLWQGQQFNAVLREVDEDLRKLLSRVEFKTLDALTKAQLTKLISELRKSQFRIYSAYTEKLILQLEQFTEINLMVNAVVYASLKHSFDNNGEPVLFDESEAIEYIQDENKANAFAALFGLGILPGGSLWASVKNAPIPANGLYLLPFVNAFSKSAQFSLENAVRKGYANKLTVQQVLSEISGKESRQGFSTQFAKLRFQSNTVVETVFSHIAQIASQAITSALFSHYQWVSIIDNSTTNICRERNGKVYKYGVGPIPPAHYRCRSVTIPLVSRASDFSGLSLYSWLKKQPLSIKKEFLGTEAATLLDAGEIGAKEFASLQIGKPLDPAQLKSKIGLILSP